MRQTELFSKTHKDFPKDEVAINAQLLIKANFVQKLMAGVYSFMPLGYRTLEKIMAIIREEMNALGASELLMPALHPRSIWDATGRWDTMKKVMYQFKDDGGREFGLGTTHEEVIAVLGKTVIDSYADLPLAAYQIQMKFRNEPRAKSGLIRGRQFIMKDLYSFHADEQSLEDLYERSKRAYLNVFERAGLKAYVTEASGGDFTKSFSHEFQVETPAGEDETLLCRLCGFARNKEIADEKAGARCPKCESGVLEKAKTVEVGNIFKLGTKFSEAAGLYFKDKSGVSKPVIMASYGIGVDRLMGTIVEVHHDEKGIVWPESVAPYKVHLLRLGDEAEVQKFADEAYNHLTQAGVEVLYDDRPDVSAGEKFYDADLIGLPYRAIVSGKTVLQEKIEVKKRSEKEGKLMKAEELAKHLKI
ncbi:His/Gly/Thr/Pro-type tRNA ligase C-terminal domain-containing protein [Patescibacteria group bacterium]|nr:His/Gly/Thr/Pro-type tRNA ligase C-terminal domain-containing protein [Patescibacteria group bacterium]